MDADCVILAASVVLGAFFGWRHGRGRSAYAGFAISWLAVLAVQTALLWTSSDSVRDRTTGAISAAYPALCLVIFALGVVVVTVADVIRQRRQLS